MRGAHALDELLDGVGRPAPRPAGACAPELWDEGGGGHACCFLLLGLVGVLCLAQMFGETVCDPVREQVGIATVVSELGDDVFTELR